LPSFPYITGMSILSLAATYGSNTLFCMPNRTKCILLMVMAALLTGPRVQDIKEMDTEQCSLHENIGSWSAAYLVCFEAFTRRVL
jgi:hypothetical protein